MSHDIVRRDEIWIADKNEDDSTKLFSLEDEQVHIDKVLDQNYTEISFCLKQPINALDP